MSYNKILHCILRDLTATSEQSSTEWIVQNTNTNQCKIYWTV